jgi:hypothetical protein
VSGSIICQNGIKNLSVAAVRISESIAPDVDSTPNQARGRADDSLKQFQASLVLHTASIPNPHLNRPSLALARKCPVWVQSCHCKFHFARSPHEQGGGPRQKGVDPKGRSCHRPAGRRSYRKCGMRGLTAVRNSPAAELRGTRRDRPQVSETTRT